jgi:CO/xanthine dehydrogenase FAD-binding subunit
MTTLPRFQYYAPGTLQEALRLLAEHGGSAFVLAGGTDLLVRIRSGMYKPGVLIDIGQLQELRGITLAGHRLQIGALETHATLAGSAIVREMTPALAAACHSVGAPPVRNRGTIGGNLANASPAADSVPPLLVLNARLRLVSLDGERDVALSEFFVGPGQTCLRCGELVQSISIRAPTGCSTTLFAKVGKRNAMACAVASVAVYLALKDGVEQVTELRLALGSVAPIPMRAHEAERILQGHALTAERIKEAARYAASSTSPITDVRATAEYRRRLSAILVERAVTDALERATRNGGATCTK